jgi:hypothetical protein
MTISCASCALRSWPELDPDVMVVLLFEVVEGLVGAALAEEWMEDLTAEAGAAAGVGVFFGGMFAVSFEQVGRFNGELCELDMC